MNLKQHPTTDIRQPASVTGHWSLATRLFSLCILHSAFCIAALAAFAASAADVPPLFDNGRTEWKVVVAQDASPIIRYAAEEFTNVVAAVSGVAIPVVSSDEGVGHAVRISAEKEEWAKEHVVYRLQGGDLLFTGNQSRAALHAVYAFLDRELGVRWLWPGEDGAFFPSRRKWEFPQKFGFDYTPAIWFRGFHHCGDWRDRAKFLAWETRNYVNIHRHGNGKHEVKYGHYSMPSMHNANLNGEKKLFEEHPECFSLLSGHRSMANICFSSDLGAQKVAERIGADIERRVKQAPVDIISIFPNGNQDYCQCPDCKAKGVSNGWFEYFNKVVAILHRRFPELRFSTIAYQVFGRGLDRAFVDRANEFACQGVWPDRTILMMTGGDAEVGIGRATRHKHADRLEMERRPRGRGGDLELARADSQRVRLVVSDDTKPATARKVFSELADLFPWMADKSECTDAYFEALVLKRETMGRG